MANLSAATISELQEIVRDERGVELTFEQASVIASAWVAYFDKLAEIKHRTQLDGRGVSPMHGDVPGSLKSGDPDNSDAGGYQQVL